MTIENEHPEVTRAKMFILEQFIKITNEKLTDSMKIVANYENEAASNMNHEDFYKTYNNSNNKLDSNENDFSIADKNGATLLTSSNSNLANNFQALQSIKSREYEIKLQRQLRKSYRDAKEESVNGKFCIPYFTCAIDTDNIKRVFKACSHILKKEHLENSGLL